MDRSTLTFLTKCPNGHFPWQIFDRAALTQARASGTLKYHCRSCDQTWSPGVEERAVLRSLLKHQPPLTAMHNR